jgi:hypothetical protein
MCDGESGQVMGEALCTHVACVWSSVWRDGILARWSTIAYLASERAEVTDSSLELPILTVAKHTFEAAAIHTLCTCVSPP